MIFKYIILIFFIVTASTYSMDTNNTILIGESMANEKIENQLWSVTKTKDKGYPVFLLFLKDLPKNVKTDDYQHMISIFWSYPVTNISGLPSKKIIKAHLDIEKTLNELDDHIDSFYVASITGNGRKEWIWYTRDIDIWWDKFSKALKNHPKYPLTIETSKELNWKTYHSISKNK